MPAPYIAKEVVESIQPVGAGFNIGGGRAMLTYDIPESRLSEALTGFIGNVVADATIDLVIGLPRAGLSRTLASAHPMPECRHLYCERLSEMRGRGGMVLTDSLPVAESEAGPFIDAYARYPKYRCTFEYAPRNYPLLKDWTVQHRVIEWSDNGTTRRTMTASEYFRFNTAEYFAKPELIKIDKGITYLVTSDADIVPPVPPVTIPPTPPMPLSTPPPHGLSTGGFARIQIPGGAIKWTWHQVPYAFVSTPDSYIRRYPGRVNQFPFLWWLPGELLYEGYNAKISTPPFPDATLRPGAPVSSFDLVCDIEFTFSETVREKTGDYNPLRNGWIANGHNLMPWVNGGRGFVYSVTPYPDLPNDQDGWIPTFESFPFELLWSNPANGPDNGGP